MIDKQHGMLKESLSALLDDEAQDLETRRVLNELDKDAELKSSWQNFQTIGDLMRDQVSPAGQMDLTAAINARIDNADIADGEVISETEQPKSWFKPITSIAVAASVTLAVLVGLQMGEQQTSASYNLASSKVTAQPLSQAHSLEPAKTELLVAPSMMTSTQIVNSDIATPEANQDLGQAQEKLKQYLLEHTENSAENTGRGVMPYARVVNYGEETVE